MFKKAQPWSKRSLPINLVFFVVELPISTTLVLQGLIVSLLWSGAKDETKKTNYLGKNSTWFGQYNTSWKGLWTREAKPTQLGNLWKRKLNGTAQKHRKMLSNKVT